MKNHAHAYEIYLRAQVEVTGKQSDRSNSFSICESRIRILEDSYHSQDDHVHMGAKMISQQLNRPQSLTE